MSRCTFLYKVLCPYIICTKCARYQITPHSFIILNLKCIVTYFQKVSSSFSCTLVYFFILFYKKVVFFLTYFSITLAAAEQTKVGRVKKFYKKKDF